MADLSPGEVGARVTEAEMMRWILALLVVVVVVASVETPAVADWPTVEMPNVLGLDVPSAKEKIERLDLILGEVKEVPSEKTPRGIVMGQGPAPGTRVIKGYEVRLYVSKGPNAAKGAAGSRIGKSEP
jgi:beta-lactam-binding protein with PASTA domain